MLQKIFPCLLSIYFSNKTQNPGGIFPCPIEVFIHIFANVSRSTSVGIFINAAKNASVFRNLSASMAKFSISSKENFFPKSSIHQILFNFEYNCSIVSLLLIYVCCSIS